MAEKKHYWDSVATHWIDRKPHGLWRIHGDEVNAKLCGRWLGESQDRNILKTDLFDEAFGPGLYERLSPGSSLFTGIDISHNVLRAARSSHEGLTALCADARCLPFADGSFDVVISNSSLDHFRTSDQIVMSLREICRVLKRPGRLLVTLDNPVNPLIALRQLLPFSWLNRAGVVPYYVGATSSPRKLRRALESIGFRVAGLDAVLHCPRVLAVLLARFVENKAGPEGQRTFLRILMSFEHLSRLPTRFLTGYFVAADARKE